MNMINSASRIQAIVNLIIVANPNESALNIWANVFGINVDRSAIKSIKVSKNLTLLHQELEILKEQLTKSSLSEKLYESALINLEEVFSVVNLGQQFAATKSYLNEKTLTSLEYWVELLPNEENLIEEDEINELIKAVDELELSLDQSSLPDSLILTIRNQIKIIREAIERYPIQGAKALRGAATSIYGELVLVKDVLKEEQTSEVSKLSKVWSMFAKTVDKAEKIETAANLIEKGLSLIGRLPNIFS